MEFKRILYASNRESSDFRGIEKLLIFRKLGLEEVVLLQPRGGGDREEKLSGYGIRSKRVEIKRSFLTEISEAVSREGISLTAIDMKDESRSGFGKSSFRKLLSSTTIPVLLLKTDMAVAETLDKEIFHHAVFATDWSPLSEKVLKYVLSFKDITEMLEVVNVINRKLSVRDMRKLKEKMVEARKVFLDEGMDAEAHIYAGKRAEEIILAASDYKATSIIMGTSGKSFIGAIFSRSCSYRVAEESPLPTFFVPLKNE